MASGSDELSVSLGIDIYVGLMFHEMLHSQVVQ